MACVINMLWAIEFPFTVIYEMLTMHTKVKCFINRILLFTIFTYDARNVYRLSFSVALTYAHPNYRKVNMKWIRKINIVDVLRR